MGDFEGNYISCGDLCGLIWGRGAVGSTVSYNDILEAEDKSDRAHHLLIFLEEIHFIMRQCIMKKLMTYLQPILKSKEDAKRFHWWSALFLELIFIGQ